MIIRVQNLAQSAKTFVLLINLRLQLLCRDLHRILGQFGHVVALGEADVVCRVSLGQEKSFVRLTILVKVGNVGTSKSSIVAARTEDYPSPIRTPGVVAIDIGAVGSRERVDLLREQIFYIKVGRLVPDVKLTIIGQGEE